MEPMNKKTKTTWLISILLGLTVLLGLLSYQLLYKNVSFMSGVKIAEVPVAGYTPDEAAVIVTAWLENAYHSPVILHYNEYSTQLFLKEICNPEDADQIIQKVWEQEKNRNLLSRIPGLNRNQKMHYPLSITPDKEKLVIIKDKLDQQLAQPYVNARLEVDPGRGLLIIPGEDGREVDIEATMAQLPSELKIFTELKLPVVMANKPQQVNAQDLKVMGELSHFTTWFNPNEVNRTHNLKIAAGTINNTLLMPGEIFSFNNIVGRRSVDRGYREALIIIGGKFEPGLAGGICQVSSTLYNTALLAGLEIVERHNHSLAIAYVPLGRDATVTYGLQDLKFRNNSEHPLYLRAVVSGSSITMNVYGHEKDKQRIELSHVVDGVIDYETRRELDPKLNPGQEIVDTAGNKGYIVRSFRTFFDAQGQVVKTEQLARDQYRPLHRVIKHGPELPQKDGSGEGLPPEDIVERPGTPNTINE